MSEGGARPAVAQAWLGAGPQPADARRRLQLVLAGLWLFDALLQGQRFMFTRGFAGMLAASAQGDPAVIAGPIAWAARLTGQHAELANAVFATVQLLLALGIAWRPTIKPALAASVGWALAVWWLGEGLGGIMTPDASPVGGAPGAALLYALLAVVLWPVRQDEGRPLEPFVAARPLGVRAARLVWAALWLGLAVLAVRSASAQGLRDLLAAQANGQPGWVGAMDRAAAAALAGRGVPASLLLAAALAAIAAAVFLPARPARGLLVLAVVIAGASWAAGQDFGGIFTGAGTDPNSGPLLALLAAAYWPIRAQGRLREARVAEGAGQS